MLAATRPARTVLVVDAITGNRAILHDLLAEAGYAVISVADPAGAARRAAEAQPDLLLLNAAAGVDGPGIVKALRADPDTASLPVIVVGGSGRPAASEPALPGPTVRLTPPVPAHALIECMERQLQAASGRRARPPALDAFGHASLVVRERDGRRLWQTALARDWLQGRYPTTPEVATPAPVMAWIAREAVRRRAGAPPHALTIGQGGDRLTFAMHPMDDDERGGEWFVVMRADAESARLERLAHEFGLAPREAELLLEVVRGRDDEEIGALLALPPGGVAAHIDALCARLGVATRAEAVTVVRDRLDAGSASHAPP